MKKLSNKDIDTKLVNLKITITRLGDYISARIPIDFQCVNKHIWKATTDNILRGKGCPQCHWENMRKNRSRSVEDVDEILNNLQIKRNQPYINGKLRIGFKCLKYECGYVWSTATNHIICDGSGCPKCAGRAPLTNEIIDKKICSSTIKRLDDFVNGFTKIQWQCLVNNCSYIWKAIPGHIINHESGCPNCSNMRKWSKDEVDEELNARKIERLDDYINQSIKIRFQCRIDGCGCIWKTAPSYILNSGTGCPLCKNKNEKLLFKLLEENDINFEYQKSINKLFQCDKNYIVDFYLSNKNIIIEYNGAQHYQPVCFGGMEKSLADEKFIKQKERDKYLKKLCIDNNIKLIVIDGRKFKNDNLKKMFKLKLINKIKENK